MDLLEPNDLSEAYRRRLQLQQPSALREILRRLELDPGRRTSGLALEIETHLNDQDRLAWIVAGLDLRVRAVLSLFALAESTSIPVRLVLEIFGALGLDPAKSLETLTERGLVALDPISLDRSNPSDPEPTFAGEEASAHPLIIDQFRDLPALDCPTGATEPVRLIREADGLEPILRVASIWQLATDNPFKRTRQGELYKRDLFRLETDPALAGPIADLFVDQTPAVTDWVLLAGAVGLLVEDPSADQWFAARSNYWSKHGVHLPQMLGLQWLLGKDRPEPLGMEQGVRFAALGTIAQLDPEAWVRLETLAEWFKSRVDESTSKSIAEVIEKVILGTAYLFGWIRVGRIGPEDAIAVQLSDRGRYAFGLGPPPFPSPIDRFLFVQPNFEVIAYRQGLNPALIGQLSQFANWNQFGAALTLRLTPESIDRGLASGSTATEIIQWLEQRAVRPLPEGVSASINSWAGRRERLSYYAATTLIEFADPESLEIALNQWPEESRSRLRKISELVLLVEDESTIPFQSFRIAGSRDYRKPPETCVSIESDGVTLYADPSRGDLFIEAELRRFADAIVDKPRPDAAEGLERRYRVSSASLQRAIEQGMNGPQLTSWFEDRTGGPPSSAIRLLIQAIEAESNTPVQLRKVLLLQAPSSELIDGLQEHPATREFFGDRLGPTTIALVEKSNIPALREALKTVGLSSLGIDPDLGNNSSD